MIFQKKKENTFGRINLKLLFSFATRESSSGTNKISIVINIIYSTAFLTKEFAIFSILIKNLVYLEIRTSTLLPYSPLEGKLISTWLLRYNTYFTVFQLLLKNWGNWLCTRLYNEELPETVTEKLLVNDFINR